MKAWRGFVPSWCLASAALLTLSSCQSFGRDRQTSMPRSEAVCDASPPQPAPEIPATHPELEASHRQLQGLYRDEVTKYVESTLCRLKVRAENAR